MGDVNMDPAATANAMGRVADAGRSMTSEWHAIEAEIAGLAGQLGRGDLGAAYLAGYRESAAQAARAADQCCRTPGVLADKGNACVGAYRSTDDAAANGFRSVAPPASP